jgi:hypothetical protein
MVAKFSAIFLFDQLGEPWVNEMKPHEGDCVFECGAHVFICSWGISMVCQSTCYSEEAIIKEG